MSSPLVVEHLNVVEQRHLGRLEARELTAAGVPRVDAVRVDDGPLVDGDVLNDPAYADARLATGFVQNRPFEGQPASERCSYDVLTSLNR